MASYELRFKRSVARDLRRLAASDVRKILQRVEAISEDPRGPGCRKLTGSNLWRVRQGDYRIIYEISDERLIVHIIKIDHRSKAYK